MTKFKNPIFSLLLVSIIFTSCNGQTKTEQPTKTVVEQQSFTSKNAKLTKTQGTTEHQNVHCKPNEKVRLLGYENKSTPRREASLPKEFTSGSYQL